MWPAVPLTPSQSHGLTRILCWLVLIGMASFVVVFALAVAGVSATALGWELPMSWRTVFLFLLPAMLYYVVGAALYIWRSCDKCRFHLYNCFDTRWLWVDEVTRLNEAARPLHPNSAKFLGSIGYGTIWRKAVSGVAHCPWCGEADRDRTGE